jgi:hypothetical protein
VFLLILCKPDPNLEIQKNPNVFLAKTEPTAAKQALGDSKWKTAMQAEYDILLAPIAPALYYI